MSGYYEFREWDDGERFMLSRRRIGYDPTCEGVGIGNYDFVTRFHSDGERAYFKRTAEAEEDARVMRWRYEELRRVLAELLTKRNVRKRLMELVR